jgi:hypothetical protein
MESDGINCDKEILNVFIENGHMAEEFLLRKMHDYENMLKLANEKDKTRISNVLDKIKAASVD